MAVSRKPQPQRKPLPSKIVPEEGVNLQQQQFLRQRATAAGVIQPSKRRMSIADQIIQSYPASERMKVMALERLEKTRVTLSLMRAIREAVAQQAL